MTREECKLSIEYLEGIKDNYVEGYGYERHPLPEYYAIESAIKALEQEPCKDAVSLTDVFEIMGNLMSIPYDFDENITEKDVSESIDKIRELPKVTLQEPNKGHWITKPHVFGVAYCSECGFELKIDNTNFCPNCGADMREGEE